MSIKGFVGFWGNDKDRALPKRLCEIYETAVVDSVFVRSESFILITSKEYFLIDDAGDVMLNSGGCGVPEADSLKVSITLTREGIRIERDRWGTRTVNYFCVKNGIYFASDVRYLLVLPIAGINEYDRISLTESATLGYIYSEERTLFKKIKQLPRNSELNYFDGKLKIKRHILSCDKKRFKDIDEATLLFEKAFDFAVNSATKITGKKAYLLSGGMDSTAIVLAAVGHADKIETISFASRNNVEDIYYAEAIAELVGSDHVTIQFNEQKTLAELPFFLHDAENIELEGIFSPLGGYAYYVLCHEVANLGFDIIFPGEGADEILGGYYWALTHTFGFVDRLKVKATDAEIYNKIVKLFPEVEEEHIYREVAYYLLQGSALTNYHLNCVEHAAKAFGLYNYPIYMSVKIDEVIRDVPLEWLCDGSTTKILLRNYLLPQLERAGLSNLVSRKKLAMPSVLPRAFIEYLNTLAEKAFSCSRNPYRDVLQSRPLNVFLMDIFHKYYTLRPLETIDALEWKEDLLKVTANERIVHW